jgi:hypothetical protein
VEVLGRYSNHADQGKRIEYLLQLALSQPKQPVPKTTKQIHRRLSPTQIDELEAAYRAGATLHELSDQFQIHRASVSIILERQGVARRYRMVDGERLQQAFQDYQSGNHSSPLPTSLEWPATRFGRPPVEFELLEPVLQAA